MNLNAKASVILLKENEFPEPLKVNFQLRKKLEKPGE